MLRHTRRRQSGSVMVEAVVVITFFVLCFLGVSYFRSLYTEKLYAQRLARASALTHAMGACQTDPRTGIRTDTGNLAVREKSSGIPSHALVSGSDKGNVGLQKIREKNGDTGLDKITAITLSGEALLISKPKDGDAPKQGFRGDVSSSSFVVCGDPMPDDRYEGMVEQIAKLF